MDDLIEGGLHEQEEIMKSRLIKNGIYSDISIGDYHSSSGLSSSRLRVARKSLAEFKYHLDQSPELEEVDGSHFDFGNAFENALMAPLEFAETVAIMPEQKYIQKALKDNPELIKVRGSKVYKSAKDKFSFDNAGKYIIMDQGKESYETIKKMLESCYRDVMIKS